MVFFSENEIFYKAKDPKKCKTVYIKFRAFNIATNFRASDPFRTPYISAHPKFSRFKLFFSLLLIRIFLGNHFLMNKRIFFKKIYIGHFSQWKLVGFKMRILLGYMQSIGHQDQSFSSWCSDSLTTILYIAAPFMSLRRTMIYVFSIERSHGSEEAAQEFWAKSSTYTVIRITTSIKY